MRKRDFTPVAISSALFIFLFNVEIPNAAVYILLYLAISLDAIQVIYIKKIKKGSVKGVIFTIAAVQGPLFLVMWLTK